MWGAQNQYLAKALLNACQQQVLTSVCLAISVCWAKCGPLPHAGGLAGRVDSLSQCISSLGTVETVSKFDIRQSSQLMSTSKAKKNDELTTVLLPPMRSLLFQKQNQGKSFQKDFQI